VAVSAANPTVTAVVDSGGVYSTTKAHEGARRKKLVSTAKDAKDAKEGVFDIPSLRSLRLCGEYEYHRVPWWGSLRSPPPYGQDRGFE